jgi:hypothetical protein
MLFIDDALEDSSQALVQLYGKHALIIPAAPILVVCSVGMMFMPSDDALEAQAKAIAQALFSRK